MELLCGRVRLYATLVGFNYLVESSPAQSTEKWDELLRNGPSSL